MTISGISGQTRPAPLAPDAPESLDPSSVLTKLAVAQFGRAEDKSSDSDATTGAPLQKTTAGTLGGTTLIGTDGDDHYVISQTTDGSLHITDSNGEEVGFVGNHDASYGTTLELGDGDDSVLIEEGVTRPLFIKGGEGNDTLTGNSVANVLIGESGDDTIVGGSGNDQLVGGTGDDEISGGSGHDFIQGGSGADSLAGEAGGDALYAEVTDRVIDVGEDPDQAEFDSDLAIVTSTESTTTESVAGLGQTDAAVASDLSKAQAYLDQNPSLQIFGSDDFHERTLADIGALLSTESGTALLDAIAKTEGFQSKGMLLTEQINPGGVYDRLIQMLQVGPWAGAAENLKINFSPLIVTAHELVHAYQDLGDARPVGSSEFEDGIKVGNDERQASGLSWLDQDGKLHAAAELGFSENSVREELGVPLRETYDTEVGEPLAYAPTIV